MIYLTDAQRSALRYVQDNARCHKNRGLARIREVLASAYAPVDAAHLVSAVQPSARITVNFHPDRLLADGRLVATALEEEGLYRNQFETKISNGGLTAFTGGDRDHWEAALFGSAYQATCVAAGERPKYGGLNLLGYGDGACPRFGSCHLRLKPDVLERATVTVGDSVSNPTDWGVSGALESVLAGCLERAAVDDRRQDRSGPGVAAFVEALLSTPRQRTQGRALDDYVEAQIHGELSLAADVEALVVDPSFRGTAAGATLEAISHKFPLSLEWHPGFELAPDEIPEHFRGPAMLPLAKRILETQDSGGSRLDAAALGPAAVSAVTDPERWEEWGTAKDVLQQIKYLWHVLVVYGRPSSGKE